jgi:ADP-ribosylglycohydrolase
LFWVKRNLGFGPDWRSSIKIYSSVIPSTVVTLFFVGTQSNLWIEIFVGSTIFVFASSAVAAAVSEALKPDSTVKSIISASRRAAKIGEIRGAQLAYPSIEKRITMATRLVFGKTPEASAEALYAKIGADIASSDSIPTAIGLFVAGHGDPMATITLAANMGGDTDTIGAMAGGITGAFAGIEAFPKPIIDTVDRVNHLDLRGKSRQLMEYARRYR